MQQQHSPLFLLHCALSADKWCQTPDSQPCRGVQNYGWEAYFIALGVSCGMALLLLAPMVNLKSYVQREEAKAKLA